MEKVGVFVNQKPEIILDTVKTAGLTGVQLHGDEDEKLVRELHRRSSALHLYKALPAKTMGLLAQGAVLGVEREVSAMLQAVLLDSGSPEKRGGTGKTFHWDDAAPVVAFIAKRMKIVIAGGLEPGNVEHAIELFRPWGVDVVSGVEKEPGKKDHEKVRAFVKAAKAAAQS